MKIRFDLFKAGSGKWGYGGEVEIGTVPFWSDDFLPLLCRNQKDVVDGTIQSGEWFMVIDHLPGDTSTSFYKQLFKPNQLQAILRDPSPMPNC